MKQLKLSYEGCMVPRYDSLTWTNLKHDQEGCGFLFNASLVYTLHEKQEGKRRQSWEILNSPLLSSGVLQEQHRFGTSAPPQQETQHPF